MIIGKLIYAVKDSSYLFAWYANCSRVSYISKSRIAAAANFEYRKRDNIW